MEQPPSCVNVNSNFSWMDFHCNAWSVTTVFFVPRINKDKKTRIGQEGFLCSAQEGYVYNGKWRGYKWCMFCSFYLKLNLFPFVPKIYNWIHIWPRSLYVQARKVINSALLLIWKIKMVCVAYFVFLSIPYLSSPCEGVSWCKLNW